MAKLNSLDDLLVHELQDIYNAESQILKALPKMAKAASHPSCRAPSRSTWSRPRDRSSGWSRCSSFWGAGQGKEVRGAWRGCLRRARR